MYTFLMILFILVCFAMVVAVLLQAGKGQGLAGTFGGPGAGGTVFGGRGAASFLSKATAILATLYLFLSLLIGYVYKSETEVQRNSLIQQEVEQTAPASTVPLAPIGTTPADTGR